MEAQFVTKFFVTKSRGHCICAGGEKKAVDALSIAGIIIPTVTLMIRSVHPASHPRARPSAEPCVREYEKPI